MEIKTEIIKAYALKNAVEHSGRAVAGSVISGLFNHGLTKEKIKEIMPAVQKVINEVNSLEEEEQRVLFKKYEDLTGHRPERQGLKELENVSKKVVMRFAPSPSGPLHIGHALTGSLSFLYVRKYGGKLYVRIEDTNPENIYPPSYKMIAEEAKWLFDSKAEIVIQSKRMELYYGYAEKLIRKGAAYVCECSSEDFKKNIEKSRECECRNLTVKENLQKWKRMLEKGKKGYKEGEAVLRFRTPEEFGGVKHKNPAMRDFPLARINLTPHVLQKKKYRVWPLMNLAVSADDIEEKMTHIIRAKDHRDNAERQKMIFFILGKKYPESYFLGRIHFKDFELSSSKMRKEVEEGKYKSWDDPALPTVASLKKQGYKPSAFWKFAEQIGLSEVDKVMDRREFFVLLKNFNRD